MIKPNYKGIELPGGFLNKEQISNAYFEILFDEGDRILCGWICDDGLHIKYKSWDNIEDEFVVDDVEVVRHIVEGYEYI